jgi:hypothetical protein
MHARFRPRAIVAVWAWQSASALLASWPAASLARAAYGSDPRGDAPLWDDGAHALLDLLSREASAWGAAASTAAAVCLATAVAGLLPMAALMVTIAHASRDRHAPGAERAVGGALHAFPALAILLVVVGLGQGVMIGAAALVGEAASGAAQDAMGEARAQQFGMVLALPCVVIAVMLGVVHDLARAAVVRLKVSGMRALALAAQTFRGAPTALAWSWGWRSLSGVAPVLLVGGVAERLGGRGGIALIALAVLHQSVVLARVALRASWLAKALRSIHGSAHRDATDR